jgi:hypothetical protein
LLLGVVAMTVVVLVSLQNTGSRCSPYSVKCSAAAANTEFCDRTSGGSHDNDDDDDDDDDSGGGGDDNENDGAAASGSSPSTRPLSMARKTEYSHGSGRCRRSPICSRQAAGWPGC